MMQLIRSKAGKVVTIGIVGGFLLWMVYGIGMEVMGAANSPNDLGSVNGTPISIAAYQQRVQALEEQARQNGTRLTAEDQEQLRQKAWTDLVDEVLIQQEMERRKIGVSDNEILFAARNIPAPEMMQQEIFQTNGQFDIQKYRSYLGSPQASDEVLGSLERYYRSQIPQMKLRQQIASGVYLSDAELWRMYRDRNESATVEYVALDLSRLAPGSVNVTDDEIRAYYDAHKDEFKRTRTARLTVAYLPTAPSEADRAAVVAHAQQVRDQLAAGGDFAAVARAESSDTVSARQGGNLGALRRGQTVAAFDSVIWTIPVNEISQPVQTQFGYHVLQVTARGGDSAVVRHILFPVKKADAALDAIDAKADTLGKLAETNLERAARSVGATLRQGVTVSEALPYIPGVGPAMEALNWATGESRDLRPGSHPVSEVFEGEQALYVVRLESYAPAGTMSVEEATPQIRETLILEKKKARAKAEGEKIVAAVRGGQTLQQAAAARGLQVQTLGPFTRMDPNPTFGAGSAAVGAAFGTPLNQVSGVTDSPAGLFIVRPTARTGADAAAFARDKEQIRMGVTQQLAQQALNRWLDSARKAARITDNREKILRGA